MKKLSVVIVGLLASACSYKAQQEKIQAEYDSLSIEAKLEPQYATMGLELPEDLEVQLFASEPMITNPSNIDVDAKGRVWLCEGFNYRMNSNPNNPYRKAGDRIVILEDTNQDGQADKSKVFYQGEDVNTALGIAVLGNKIYVSASPNVLVFTDTNGDDVPDTKEIMFTGISGLQHDHGMHAISFGADGKLYFNFGNEGKQLRDKNGKPLKDKLGRTIENTGKPYREGMIFRCNPDGSEIEVLGSNFRNNYEVAVDSFTRLWQSDNDDDGNKGVRINYVLDHGKYGYKDEMTGAYWAERRINMEDSIPHRHWHLNDPGVVPNLLQTGAGSPTGMCIYEGSSLPVRYRNQMIHTDAGPRVVRAYPVEKSGAGFKATIEPIMAARRGNEWFRPSDVATAPDGSLFVSDWFDPGVGGHAMKDSLRGRIFRIVPKGEKAYKVPKLDLSTVQGAIDALKNPNIATRYLGFDVLVKMGKAIEEPIKKHFTNGQMRERARVLGVLANIPDLAKKYIEAALDADQEDMRVAGIRMLVQSKFVDPFAHLHWLAKSPSAQIRREVALALHGTTRPEAKDIWVNLAGRHDGADRWYLEALGIAAEGNWDAWLPAWEEAVGRQWNKTPGNKDIIWRSRAKNTVSKLVDLISQTENPKELPRYFRALDFNQDPQKDKLLEGLLSLNKPAVSVLVAKSLSANNAVIKPQLTGILAATKNPIDYLDLVEKYKVKTEADKVGQMAIAYADSSLGQTAAEVLLRMGSEATAVRLVNDPNSRAKALTVFKGHDAPALLKAFASVATNTQLKDADRYAAIDALRGWNGDPYVVANVVNKLAGDFQKRAYRNLSMSWRSEIRKMARDKTMASNTNALGNKIPQLALATGNAAAGQKVFEAYCQTCHQVNGKGVNFGPALSEIGTKYGKEGLLRAILKPSEGISFGYENHAVTLKNGTELMGLVSAKTESGFYLRQIGEAQPKYYSWTETKAFDELVESPMPIFDIAEKDMINLVEYLNGLRKK